LATLPHAILALPEPVSVDWERDSVVKNVELTLLFEVAFGLQMSLYRRRIGLKEKQVIEQP
jgi:hypothetical protein